MSNAKLFSVLVCVVSLAYAAVGFYFLPAATFEGELTRMAMMPEAKFGWRKPQPAIDAKLMTQAKWDEADVLVVGDSFSDPRIWQTLLVREGIRVRTEQWNNVRGLCEDFMPWLRKLGFKGKYVVFEQVERHAVSDLERSLSCKKMDYRLNSYTDAPRKPPIVSFDPDLGSYGGSLSIGWKTQVNDWWYERWSSSGDFSLREMPNGTRLGRVKDGCKLFSHRSCNDVLFIAEDRGASDLPGGLLQTVEALNRRTPGIVPIWVFVPDKTTAYLYPDKKFWDEAEKRFNSPHLLRMTQRAINDRVVDLYPANGTHFTTTGYLLMGEEILKTLRQAGLTSIR